MPFASAVSARRAFVLASLLLAWSDPASAFDSVFAGFAGAWTGSGTVTMANGEMRKIACSSTYVIGPSGATLKQSLDCSSDGVRLQLTASYIYADGGALSGDWSEATRGAHGALNGSARAGRINATVAAIGFVGGLGLNAHGRQQSLTLQAQGGGDFRKVAISLHKV